MEKLKPLEEALQPDARNLLFVRLDTLKHLTFEEHYAEIAAIVLNPSVPDDVRSYFATVQNICLYAWFAYDFDLPPIFSPRIMRVSPVFVRPTCLAP